MPKEPSTALKLPAPAVRSLQINIDSEDDAKAVIQHLPEIKRTWDTLATAGLVDSVEFCIAQTIRRKVDGTLIGAIRWCRTYIKQVAPFEGNVFFALPHYRGPAAQNGQVRAAPEAQAAEAPVEEPAPKPAKVNRYLRNLPPEQLETPGKTQCPVSTAQPGV